MPLSRELVMLSSDWLSRSYKVSNINRCYCYVGSLMLNDSGDNMSTYFVFLDVSSYDVISPRHLFQKTGEWTIWQFLGETRNVFDYVNSRIFIS